jgi:hypothetical protein
MVRDVLALLEMFKGRVPDPETHGWVTALVEDPNRWPEGHEIFDRVRRRNLEAIGQSDYVRECQYCFEEVCLKSFYNESNVPDPFDSDSPYWIIKNAIPLARALGVSDRDVLLVVVPEKEGN